MEIIATILGILVMAFAALFGQIGQIRLDVEELRGKLGNNTSKYDELKEILDRIDKKIEPLKIFEVTTKFRLRRLEARKKNNPESDQ